MEKKQKGFKSRVSNSLGMKYMGAILGQNLPTVQGFIPDRSDLWEGIRNFFCLTSRKSGEKKERLVRDAGVRKGLVVCLSPEQKEGSRERVFCLLVCRKGGRGRGGLKGKVLSLYLLFTQKANGSRSR